MLGKVNLVLICRFNNFSFLNNSVPKTTPVAFMSSVANMKIKQHSISKPNHKYQTNHSSHKHSTSLIKQRTKSIFTRALYSQEYNTIHMPKYRAPRHPQLEVINNHFSLIRKYFRQKLNYQLILVIRLKGNLI